MDSSFVKLEFGVQMTCESCENAVKTAFVGIDAIKNVEVDRVGERVVVETTLPVHKVKELIETTGKRAVVLGLGSGKGKSLRGLGAAVAMMDGCGAQGVARIVQLDEKNCIIDGTIDGLTPGKHQLQIHEFGDLTQGCDSCGDVYTNPFVKSEEKEGDLGTVEANASGRAEFRLDSERVQVSDIIGRSMVIHDLSKQEKSGSGRIACGIIARSSGLFENSKRICACDGVSLWDERDVPLAGKERQMHGKL